AAAAVAATMGLNPLPGRVCAAAAPGNPSSPGMPAPQRSYDIPAGPLHAALMRFASEAGIYLAGSIELTDGKSGPGLRGSYTPQQGLARLLAGSGLRAVPDADRRYVLQPLPRAPVSELPTVTVTGQSESATGPVVGYIAQRSATATKTDTSILETPRSEEHTSELQSSENLVCRLL